MSLHREYSPGVVHMIHTGCHATSTRRCDALMQDKTTCNKPLCGFCTHRVWADLDLCPDHAPKVSKEK